MAKKEKQEKAVEAPRGRRGVNRWAVIIILMFLVLLFPATSMILCVGMLPTIVAFIAERRHNSMVWICIGSLNAAGVVPYIMDIWFVTRDFGKALNVVFSIFPWLVWYGSAGLGWVIYMATPPIVGIFLALAASTRVAALKSSQRKLVEKWGREVAGDMDRDSDGVGSIS